MSKKVRVAWDDLQPGDLIHVKGSTNVYQFKSRADWPDRIKIDAAECKAHPCLKSRIGINIDDLKLVVLKDDFAYATRPAPKKPRPNIVEPKAPGEYWLRVHAGELTGWYMCIRRQLDSLKDTWGNTRDLKVWQTAMCGLSSFSPWQTWKEMLGDARVSEVLSAEEYYTRKAKGQL